MTDPSTRAAVIVAATGVLWGFYWLPLRALDAAGWTGAWGTLAVTLAAVLILAPLAWPHRHALRTAGPLALASIAVGGAAFAIYSVGLVHGRVAIVILLYFLTPVWSSILGRLLFGHRATPRRIATILTGIAGLVVMLAATGNWPIPRSSGEWMGLAGGVLWAIGTTGMKSTSDLAPLPSALVFALGAALTALIAAPLLGPVPPLAIGWSAVLLAVVAGIVWWGLSIAALMWATLRVDPARGGILLMTEVLVGALSAALIAGEALLPLELVGGALVLAAGVLEVWPARVRRG